MPHGVGGAVYLGGEVTSAICVGLTRQSHSGFNPPPFSISTMRRATSLRLSSTLIALTCAVLALTLPAAAQPQPILVKDINSGSRSSGPSSFVTTTDGTLYFIAEDGTSLGIWTSDGTGSGTNRVTNISGDVNDAAGLVAVGNRLFFAATESSDRELWTSDGTISGTARVADINPGSGSSSPFELTAAGDLLFFVATDDGTTGRELWRSDGTAAGTFRLTDISPGAAGSSPIGLTAVGSTLFFAPADPVNGSELWKTDGTVAGTQIVRDILPGSLGSNPRNLTVAGSTLFFTTQGNLWTSDGMEAGTQAVPTSVRNVNSVVALGSEVYFTATAAGESGLYRSDGTEQGTVLVSAGVSSTSSDMITVAAGAVYFSADVSGSGPEPWRSGGTEATTGRIADVRPGPEGSSPSNFSSVGPTVYFQANDGTNGAELWRTDGTEAGTVLVGDLSPGSSGSGPRYFHAVGQTLFFSARTNADGYELWKIDGADVSVGLTAFGATLDDIALSLAGPSPFADRSSVTLSVGQQQFARVALFDALGREVAVLYDGAVSGSVELSIPGDGLASGVYVVRAEGESGTVSRLIIRSR